MGLFNKRFGDREFELIIYDVENEIEAENIKMAIKQILGTNRIKVYTVTKDKIYRENDNSYPEDLKGKLAVVKAIVKRDYPIKEDEYLAIATDIVKEQEKDDLGLDSLLENNISINIVVEANTGSLISLSKILNRWLENLSKENTSLIDIILPIPITAEELWQRLEDLNRNAWQVLSAA